MYPTDGDENQIAYAKAIFSSPSDTPHGSETPCTHELWERESACADGYCPICLAGRLREAEARLPDRMKHCTILFKECELGHGWLTATNWVEHGCPTCRAEAAERRLREAEQDRDGYRVSWQKVYDQAVYLTNKVFQLGKRAEAAERRPSLADELRAKGYKEHGQEQNLPIGATERRRLSAEEVRGACKGACQQFQMAGYSEEWVASAASCEEAIRALDLSRKEKA